MIDYKIDNRSYTFEGYVQLHRNRQFTDDIMRFQTLDPRISTFFSHLYETPDVYANDVHVTPRDRQIVFVENIENKSKELSLVEGKKINLKKEPILFFIAIFALLFRWFFHTYHNIRCLLSRSFPTESEPVTEELNVESVFSTDNVPSVKRKIRV